MKKTLYSLMLSDDVVREVDRAAHRLGTSRSNLINQVLADYVNLTTPERRINDIFTAIDELMQPSRDLVTFFAPNTPTISFKSSLEYKYRPTVKYEVALYDGDEKSLGELSVIFRTQSESLITAMTQFFRIWKRIEEVHLIPLLSGYPVNYALYDGKFVRSISIPDIDCSSKELAGVLSNYIKLFDKMMKGYLTGNLTVRDIEGNYTSYLSKQRIYI